MKVLQVLNALFLVATGIIHFISFSALKSMNAWVMTLYLFVFAAIFVLVEFSRFNFRQYFYFMNFGWGKGIFCLYLGLLLVGNAKSINLVDILAGIWLLIMAVIFILISCANKQIEVDYVNDLMNNVESKEAPAPRDDVMPNAI